MMASAGGVTGDGGTTQLVVADRAFDDGVDVLPSRPEDVVSTFGDSADDAPGNVDGGLAGPWSVTARARGLVGIGVAVRPLLLLVSGVGCSIRKVGRVAYGVLGADSVDDAGRAMHKTDLSTSISVGLSVGNRISPARSTVSTTGRVAVDVALSAVTFS